ncbi:MAG TPA: RodZ domain-containing protein, partial [Actinomycetota bacterium]|nr:RodZ domain-containing protein [Actinomycetota bacterium]
MMQPETSFPIGSDRGVGANLQRAREERGVSLSEVAQATRIRPRYLEALENDAPEDVFPGRVYARFFLREYARYLRLPDQPLVEALDARWTVGPPQEETLAPVLALAPMERSRRWPGRLVTLIAVALLATLVSLSVVAGGRGDRAAEPPLGATTGGPSAGSTSGAGSTGGGSATRGHAPPGAGGSVTPPEVTSIRARLVAADRCWVYARAADGRVLFSQTLEPGMSTSLQARRGLDLQLG